MTKPKTPLPFTCETCFKNPLYRRRMLFHKIFIMNYYFEKSRPVKRCIYCKKLLHPLKIPYEIRKIRATYPGGLVPRFRLVPKAPILNLFMDRDFVSRREIYNLSDKHLKSILIVNAIAIFKLEMKLIPFNDGFLVRGGLG